MNGNSAALRECVVERLELPSNADDTTLRRALVERLQAGVLDGESGLDPILEVGACLLAGRQVRRTVAAPLERAQAKELIEDFCSRFFELAPADRAREFECIREQCERFRELTARVTALKRGLDVRVEDIGTLAEPAQVLARFACELFVLSPIERIQRRREILRSLRPGTHKAGVSGLRADAPVIAALCPRFLDDVSALGTQDAIVRSEVRKKARELVSSETRSGQRESSDSGSRNYWWLVVPAIMMLVRLAGNASSSRYSARDYTYRPSPAYRSNQLDQFRSSSNSSPQNIDPEISRSVVDELLKRQADPDSRSLPIVTTMDELRAKYQLDSSANDVGIPQTPDSGTPPPTDYSRLLNPQGGSSSGSGKRVQVVTVDSASKLDAKIDEIKDAYQGKGVITKVLSIRSDQLATRPFNEINDLLPHIAPALIKTLDSAASEGVRRSLRDQFKQLVNACDNHLANGRVLSPQAAAALEKLRDAL